MAKNKKIGLLNFHYSNHNYGAVLQASALEYCIREKGYQVEHIDFIPQKKVSFIGKLKSKLKPIIQPIDKFNLVTKDKVDFKPEGSFVFEDFRKKWISRSITYNLIENLEKIKDYTDIIVGSDQVWRPYYTKNFSKVYFLDFCGSSVNKVSYAASFGCDEWDKKNHSISEYKPLLEQFDAISVRENTGVSICNDVFNIKAEHVLDPTLLVGKEFFNRISGDIHYTENENLDIIYYKLDISSDFLSMIDVVTHENKRTFSNIYYKKLEGVYLYNSVEEWVSKIRDANLILTDSFHCVCLSLLFHKQFIVIANETRGLTRLISLLKPLGLEERICFNDLEIKEKILNDAIIDYKVVDAKLSILREKSMSFLINSLRK